MRRFKTLIILIGITAIFIVFLSFGRIEDKDDPTVKLNNLERTNDSSKRVKNKKQKLENSSPRIVILSQFRTGATLIGDILNKNPDMFYLYEPLNCFLNRHDQMFPYEDTYSKFLARIFECKFSTKSSACLGNSDRGVTHSKSVSNICERVTGVNGIKCPLASPGIYQKECMKHGGTMAVKVVNADLDEFESIIEESDYNVKIIHVVRDPRGTAHSRRFFMMTPEEKQYVKTEHADRPNDIPIRSLEEIGLFHQQSTPDKLRIDHLCKRMKNNLQTALKQPMWLQNRYMLVRFEDYTNNPVEISKRIYSFLDLEIPHEVLQWLDLLTEPQQDTSQLSNGASLFLPHLDVSDFATEWRSFTRFDDITRTQTECHDIMHVLGYKGLVSEDDIWNDGINVIGTIANGVQEKLNSVHI